MNRVFFLLCTIFIYVVSGCIFEKNNNSENVKPLFTNIIINEIFYTKNDISIYNSWVEIYNPFDIDVDISYWMISDKVIAPTVNCVPFFFPENTIIKSKEFILVAANSDTFFTHFSKPDEIKLYSGCLFAAEDDEICLKNVQQVNDPQQGTVDSVYWGTVGVNPAPSVGRLHSLARYTNWPDTDNCSEDFYDENLPTPGEKNHKLKP